MPLYTNEREREHPEELYADPPNRHPGTTKAPWGEEPYKNPDHNTTGVWQEFLNDNPVQLKRLFDHFDPAARVARRIVESHFDKDYDSRTPLLRKYASAVPTLAERVRNMR